jgi:hypothetical protein
MKPQKVSKFQNRSAVYKCLECGKMTRETGDGESSVEMCATCYEICGTENMHSDEGHKCALIDCNECKEKMSQKALAAQPAFYKK